MVNKIQRRNKIKARIRGKISGTAQRPRMSVFRSNKQIYVQLIDDLEGRTLVAAKSSALPQDKAQGTKTQVAEAVGAEAARRALEAGITEVVFDRNGYLFHGRVKALADGARAAGLKF